MLNATPELLWGRRKALLSMPGMVYVPWRKGATADAAIWRLFGDAEIGEALRDCREHAVELAGLRHFVIHVRLSGAAPEQRGVAVDHPDRVELDIVGLGIGAHLVGARVDHRLRGRPAVLGVVA